MKLSKQAVDVGNIVDSLRKPDDSSLAVTEIQSESIYTIDNVAFNFKVDNGRVIMRLVGQYENKPSLVEKVKAKMEAFYENPLDPANWPKGPTYGKVVPVKSKEEEQKIIDKVNELRGHGK